MSIHTLLLYIISSFVLSLLLQEVEKRKKKNIMDSIIISNIFLLLLSGVFSTFHLTENNDNIFLIALFQVLGSIFYTNCIQEISIWQTKEATLKKYSITLITSYLLNVFFINQTKNVFPNIEGMKIILWLLVVSYLYLFLKNNISINNWQNQRITYYNDKEYIIMQYAKFKNRYNRVVHLKYKELTPLIYAMMIYENYHHPELLRKIDHLKYHFFHNKGKFGIMQIYSNYELTDEKSIQLTIRKLEHLYQRLSKQNKKNIISNISYHYYHRYNKELIIIHKHILDFDRKEKYSSKKKKFNKSSNNKKEIIWF